MHNRLLIVNVDPVVGDENAGRCSVSFRVDELIEPIDGRKPVGPDLSRVLTGLGDGEIGALYLASVLAGSDKGLFQGNGRRRILRKNAAGERCENDERT